MVNTKCEGFLNVRSHPPLPASSLQGTTLRPGLVAQELTPTQQSDCCQGNTVPIRRGEVTERKKSSERLEMRHVFRYLTHH